VTVSNARRANAANIGKKIQAGKIVSKADRIEYEEVQAALAEEKEPAPAHPLDLPTSQVADFFGVTVKCVADWHKAGCPKVRYGVSNLKAVYDWRSDNIEVRDGDSATLTELKAENLRIRNERDRALTDQVKGRLVSLEEVRSEWMKVIMEFRQASLALPVRLPPVLEGKGPDDMRATIKEHVYAMLTALARPGKHRPTAKRRKR